MTEDLSWEELIEELEKIKGEFHGIRIEMIPYNVGGFSYECVIHYRDYPNVHKHGESLKEALAAAISQHNRSFGRKG
jgi:hypothetical protein